MSDKFEMLEVVDENDNVVGLETRDKIHTEGLLHREIHIFFLTPQGEIIFQHRSKSKNNNPDKLDATVAGHVTPGMSYEESAIKECKEETGVDVKSEDLVFLAKMKRSSVYKENNIINNIIRIEYAYLYKGLVSELLVEEGEGLGFEAYPIDDLLEFSESDKNKFVERNLSNEFLDLFKKAQSMLIT